MDTKPPHRRPSVFEPSGFKRTVDDLLDVIREVYLSDAFPWVVGYSGGKDSTAALSLVWRAIEGLPAEQRKKPVHVISTDTLVESPVVAAWVGRSLDTIREAATAQGMPVVPHRLTPAIPDTFWVNLIGRGYPAPRQKFRWCTERMKIKPSNNFIRSVVRASGEAILVLGTRKAESSRRHHNMEKYEKLRTRDRLSPNANLPNCLIFTPVEDWSNDDVWMFLMQAANPWGYNNKALLTMYQGASADGECPLVVDSSTPSCGDSRFGCWVCTVVDRDKSMEAMIRNDEEKEWMLPLLEIRNALDVTNDRHLRDFRRMSGAVQVFKDRVIPGPYTQDSRETWLRKVLSAQKWIRTHGPPDVRGIELISLDELKEIRRLWVVEKHEVEDSLPRIYQEALGEPFPGTVDEALPFGLDEMQILKRACGGDRLRYEMARELLDVERRYRSMSRRAGLYEALEDTIRKHFFADGEDALQYAKARDAHRVSEMARAGSVREEPSEYDAAGAGTQPAETGAPAEGPTPVDADFPLFLEEPTKPTARRAKKA